MIKRTALVILLCAAGSLSTLNGQTRIIETVVGGGPNNLPPLSSNLQTIRGIAVDAAGNYYVVSADQNRVFKVDAAGTALTVFAGSGAAGFNGDAASPALTALLNVPSGISIDAGGNLLIADTGNNRIRRVDAFTGMITTVAGTGVAGYGGNGGPAIQATLNQPRGVVAMPNGDIYVADTGNHQLRRISGGAIFHAAGDPALGGLPPAAGNNIPQNGDPTLARLNGPQGLTLDASGRVYVADTANNRVLQFTPGIPATIGVFVNSTLLGGDTTGPALTAKLLTPMALSFDITQNALYIADSGNHRVKKVGNLSVPGGATVSNFIGTGVAGTNDGINAGIATNSQLNLPSGVGVLSPGIVLVGDTGNHVVRRVNQANVQAINAGNGLTTFSGDGFPAASAAFNGIRGVAFDRLGNMFVADSNNYRIRRVDVGTGIVNTIAGTGQTATTGEGGQPVSAGLNSPWGLAFDASGNLFESEANSNIVREITATNGLITVASSQSTSVIRTVAGGGPGGVNDGDGGAPTQAILRGPRGLVVDANNNLYIAEFFGYRVRRVNLNPSGVISRFAGNTIPPVTQAPQVNVAATTSSVDAYSLAIDRNNNLLIGEDTSKRVRYVNAQANILPFAGAQCTANTCPVTAGFSPDGTVATQALMQSAAGLAVDASNNVFITDNQNQVIRMVTAATGTIATVAGGSVPGNPARSGFGGDGGSATQALLNNPHELSIGPNNTLYITDTDNNRIRLLGLPPALNIIKNHTGNFTQGQAGATYTVTVSNSAGTLPTSSTVTVTETVPSGLILNSMAGPGWNCTFNACTRSDALAGGSSYPVITVTVSVAANAASQVTNQVSVSGGGSASASANDVTNISRVAASIAPVQGSGQSAQVNTTFVAALQAVVKDGGGNPMPNVTVTFAAPTSGPGGVFSGFSAATALTNAAGVATAPAFTANSTTGGYNVTASVAGVFTSATFSLTNTPPPICGVNLDQTNVNIPADPGTVIFTITAPSTCTWTVQSNASWANFIVSAIREVRNTLTLSGTRSLAIDIRRNTSSVAQNGTIVVNGSVLTIHQAGSSDASNLRFVYAMFNNFLAREPGQVGVDFFLPLLNSGTLGRSEMAYNMFSAPEFNLIERYVIGLYYGILGRDPDYYGWDFHRRNMHLGVVQQDTLARDFLNSAEYALRYGNPTNAGFVQLLYQNALGRPASAPDLAYWQGLLDTGTATRVQVAQAILNSLEFQQGHSTRQTVFLMHATMLSREPGDFGYQYWMANLNGGMPLLTAVNAFIQSPEFQIKLGP